ncbi:uncharacterized protein LOC119923210, partial [Tachyglossus aculeatus]|uniref:uncharacterized protein LOC119923210 n=1 Tax=Tachyglossus aculeatus TaxID=9261 RepID=UPI0018F681E9
VRRAVGERESGVWENGSHPPNGRVPRLRGGFRRTRRRSRSDASLPSDPGSASYPEEASAIEVPPGLRGVGGSGSTGRGVTVGSTAVVGVSGGKGLNRRPCSSPSSSCRKKRKPYKINFRFSTLSHPSISSRENRRPRRPKHLATDEELGGRDGEPGPRPSPTRVHFSRPVSSGVGPEGRRMSGDDTSTSERCSGLLRRAPGGGLGEESRVFGGIPSGSPSRRLGEEPGGAWLTPLRPRVESDRPFLSKRVPFDASPWPRRSSSCSMGTVGSIPRLAPAVRDGTVDRVAFADFETTDAPRDISVWRF